MIGLLFGLPKSGEPLQPARISWKRVSCACVQKSIRFAAIALCLPRKSRTPEPAQRQWPDHAFLRANCNMSAMRQSSAKGADHARENKITQFQLSKGVITPAEQLINLWFNERYGTWGESRIRKLQFCSKTPASRALFSSYSLCKLPFHTESARIWHFHRSVRSVCSGVNVASQQSNRSSTAHCTSMLF